MTDITPSPTPEQNDHEHRASFFEQLDHQLHMRPRWMFVLKNIAIALSMTIIAALLVFAIGNAMFLWRSRELTTVLSAGGPAPSVFVRHFPWEAVVMSFLGVFGLLFLLRHFSASYRWPSILLLGVVLIGGASLATLSTFTPLHGTIANRALRPDAPRFFQQTFRPDIEDGQAIFGEITVVTQPTKFTIETRELNVVVVTVTPITEVPQDFTPAVGQRILVIGEVSHDEVTATAIRQGRPGMMRPAPWNQ